MSLAKSQKQKLLTLELRQLTQATLRLVRSSLCGDADEAASTDGGVGAMAHTAALILIYPDASSLTAC